MIIGLAICIGMSKEADLRFKDFIPMMGATICLDIFSYYANSIMSIPYYKDGELVGLQYAVNYFSSYDNPLGIIMSSKGQYFIYLAIRLALAMLIILLAYLPFAKRGSLAREEG